MGLRLRAVLLASSAVIAAPALAQDATWNDAGMQWDQRRDHAAKGKFSWRF